MFRQPAMRCMHGFIEFLLQLETLNIQNVKGSPGRIVSKAQFLTHIGREQS